MENHGKDILELVAEDVVSGQNELKDFFIEIGWDHKKALTMMAFTASAIMYNNNVVDEYTKFLFYKILQDAKDGKMGRKKKQ